MREPAVGVWRYGALSVACGVSLALLAGCAPALDAGDAPAPACEALVDDARANHPLRAEVQRLGTVPALVMLSLETQPESELDSAAAAAQRQRIAAAQSSVLALLQGTESRVRHRYERFALLSVALDEEGLCRLLASPLVAQVSADVADRPAG